MPLICMDKPGGTYWKNVGPKHKRGILLRNGLISPTISACINIPMILNRPSNGSRVFIALSLDALG